MLKIEFVVGLDVPAQLEHSAGVVVIDYLKWIKMEKPQRQYILEHFRDMYASHQRWLKDKGEDEATMTANERRLGDDLEDIEERVFDDVDYKGAFEECEREREILLSTHEALVADLKASLTQKINRIIELGAEVTGLNAELKQEVEGIKELGSEVAAWRNFVRRLERTWYECYSLQSFGENSAPIVKQMFELLNSVDNVKPVDKARMSVPDSDEDFDWNLGLSPNQYKILKTIDKMTMPNELCYVLRGYDPVGGLTVYWQSNMGWKPELNTAKLFTRRDAMELAAVPRPMLVVTNVTAINLNELKEQN